MKIAKYIPYGITNFETIRRGGYHYVDKSRFIAQMEKEMTKCHFLIRPRKFGKSLFANMLDYYYDVRHTDNHQMKNMKRLVLFLLIILFWLPLGAAMQVVQQAETLSQQAEISLITCSPTDDAVFTVYGHTAIRFFDPVAKIDRVFNYGVFNFDKPNFVYRFAKGETDYMLSGYDFRLFLFEYTMRGSEVYEQILNLKADEKEALWQALVWNEKPENRVYRYNFFFDNCATRPVVMIENNLQGIIRFAPEMENSSFRTVINYCTRNRPWQTFGCDLVLGSPTDRLMTQKETFFLPYYLKIAFDKAEIIREGKAEPLVKRANRLAEQNQEEAKPLFITSPLCCFSLLFLLILLLTYLERSKLKYSRIVDVILFFVAGIAGCIIFFLSFFSVHPCIFPNINLLWLHPLHLIGAVIFAVKKWKKIAFWYHCINFAALIMMVAGWIFIPQHFNLAFIPLILCLLLRSGKRILGERRREKGESRREKGEF